MIWLGLVPGFFLVINIPECLSRWIIRSNDGVCDDFCDRLDYADCGIEFPPGIEEMDALLEFFHQAVDTGDIEGVGASASAENSHLAVFDRMLDSTIDLLAAENAAAACETLTDVALRADGSDLLSDFVEGNDVTTLHAMIM